MDIEHRCSICHSPLEYGIPPSEGEPEKLLTDGEIEELRQEGIYIWSDDPILTHRGLAGDDYKGFIEPYWKHLKEIQEARKQQEIDAGIPEAEQTEFKELSEKENNPNKIIQFTKQQIEKLRTSTEKILKELGITKDDNGTEVADLENYFNNNENGDYLGTYKYGKKIEDKIEWTRIDRTTGQPSLPSKDSDPSNSTNWIRALDIEELRHPISIPLQIGILSDEKGYWIKEDKSLHRVQESDFYTYRSSKLIPKKHYEYEFSDVFTAYLTPSSYKTSDKKYLWKYIVGLDKIISYNWNKDNNRTLYLKYLYLGNFCGMFSDGTYLWFIMQDEELNLKVYTIGVDNLAFSTIELIGTIEMSEVGDTEYESRTYLQEYGRRFWQFLSMDKSYFYIMRTYEDDIKTDTQSHQRIEKIKKPILKEEVISKSVLISPEEPEAGDRYLIINPTDIEGNEWFGNENKITTYTASGWIYENPEDKWLIKVNDEDKKYIFKEENWIEWLEKLEYQQLRNINTEYNLSTSNNYPIAIDPSTGNPTGEVDFIALSSRQVMDECYLSNILLEFDEINVNEEYWKCLGSDDKHIYFQKKIDKIYYGEINERYYTCVTSEKSYGRYKDENIYNKIIRISKETLEIDEEWIIESLEILGEGRDFKGTCENSWHIDQQIRSSTIDENHLYFLCSDVHKVNSENLHTLYPYTKRTCPLPDCGERIVLSQWCYWAPLLCPDWFDEDGAIDFGSTSLSELLPIGYIKIFNKITGKLVTTYNQQIGNFNEENLMGDEILEDKQLDFDSYKRHLDDNNLDYNRFYLTIGSTAQENFAKNKPKYLQTE